jgi:FtsP/CotA-like multicopper oxidase with cupredoxin domain
MLTRRQFVACASSVVAGAALTGADVQARYARKLGTAAEPGTGKTVGARLVAAERQTALPCFGGRRLPMWTFGDGAQPPVLRLDLGDGLEASLENRLPRADEITSIHWHGIRLPNHQDGVPYLVQAPVRPGESFQYSFVPPDTGTFFFHTHCNTVEQLGRGLMGVLIVEGDTTEAYDADKVLVLRDWHVDLSTGEFTPFFTLRGAGRAGTFGPLRSVNGVVNPEIRLPAAGDCRLRLINADTTRIMHIGIEGADAAIIAVDGVAIPPVPLTLWALGPAMRIDIVLRAPQRNGTARLLDRSTPERVELAHFAGDGEPRRRSPFSPAPLRAGRIAEPDLKKAIRLGFIFNSGDTGRLDTAPDAGTGGPLGGICTSARTFWTINHRAWPEGGHASLPPPLALLQRGRSYVFQLKNDSEFSHPIHFHGHTFKLLRSNKQDRPAHHADTLLLLPKEEAEVAFVADNPGDWMFHCHVIEHQETGMMGYVRVA